MPALPGMHYCKEHQGNHAHYADHNCAVCMVALLLSNHKQRMTGIDARHPLAELDSLRSFHNAVKMLMANPPRTGEKKCQN